MWFTNWWDGLTLLQQCFAVVAIPATVILVLQTVLLLFGLGGHDADHGEVDADHDLDHDMDHDFDHDVDHDFDHDHDFNHDHDLDHDHDAHDGAHHAAGIRLFTLRGIVALFAVGGWLGVAMCDLGLSPALAGLIAAAGGFAALVIAALVIKYALRLQENGNIAAKNAVAHTATVYIPIPAARSGCGKVTMHLQERFVEMDALTDCDRVLKTGETVQVVGVTDEDRLVVRPLCAVKN